MDLTAKHVGYVLAAYGVAFVLLALLVGSVMLRMRVMRKRLAELEEQGAARRAPARKAVKTETAGATLVQGRKPL